MKVLGLIRGVKGEERKGHMLQATVLDTVNQVSCMPRGIVTQGGSPLQQLSVLLTFPHQRGDAPCFLGSVWCNAYAALIESPADEPQATQKPLRSSGCGGDCSHGEHFTTFFLSHTNKTKPKTISQILSLDSF